MNGDYQTKKHWADKVAFLILFTVALLIARFIVVSRSSVAFSGPIELKYGGLSVSVPAGNGWQGIKQWKYQGDSFILGSFLALSPDNVIALVSCRYQLAPEKISPEVLFKEKASATGSVIKKTGRIEINGPALSGKALAVDWAHIRELKTGFDTFFGTMQLPSNHRLDIEVYQTVGDTNLADRIFKSVTKSLKFTGAQMLESGSKIITEIKSKGLSSFFGSGSSEGSSLNSGEREAFFMIKDTDGHILGFTMEALGPYEQPQPEAGPRNEEPPSEAATKSQLDVLAASFFYVRHGRYGHSQATLFQSDKKFNEFFWKSEVSGLTGRSGAEMALGKDDVMTIRKFDGRFEEKRCQISTAAIPDILGDLIFSQMIESNQKEVFVDIIGADGKIIPTFVSGMERFSEASQHQSGGGAAAEKGAVYIVTVDFLDGRGFSEQVYLDDRGQVSGRLLEQEGTYVLERTSTANVLREFPEQASYILQRKDEVFKQSQPP